jgi:eukaryotic-like serine/threonine-protein kinase
VTGPGWGQDPFNGGPFRGDPFGGGQAPSGPAGGPAPSYQPPPVYTPPPVYMAPPPHQPGGPGANVLATLSVVFAFVFAPAGAVLGHVGLYQIARTRERGRSRALIGITLSYTIIVLSVVGLVIWSATGNHPKPIAQPGSTSKPSTSTSKRPVAPLDPKAINAGRTVDAADLPGLLLNVEQVKTIMAGVPSDAVPVPNLTAQPPTTALEPSPGEQGSVDPADCAPSMIAGSQVGYQDGGEESVYSVTMDQPGPEGAQSVTQSVLVYPDAATAQQALASLWAIIQRCAKQQAPGQTQPGGIDFAERDGGSRERWGTFPQPEPFGTDDRFYLVSNQRFEPDSATRGFYTGKRALAVKGNAVVDIAVRGFGVYFQEMDMMEEILKKLG